MPEYPSPRLGGSSTSASPSYAPVLVRSHAAWEARRMSGVAATLESLLRRLALPL
jgi:hypothetical protein